LTEGNIAFTYVFEKVKGGEKMKKQSIFLVLAIVVLFGVPPCAYDAALTGDIAAWGANAYGQCNVPPGSDFVAIAGGAHHSLGLRSDGSLAAWGFNNSGQLNVPPGNDFVAIAGGYSHSLALRSDGSLAARGYNGNGQCNVPAGNDFVAIASGCWHSLALVGPPYIDVTIDIKPGSYPNSINLGSNGNVPVAIFSTEDFDATNVDPLTVTLAGASVRIKGKGTPQASASDVNGDGLLDLIVHVDTTTLQLSEANTEAILEGETFDGQKIRGTDTIRIVN
jgi:hypothetical protein